jgi:phosphonate transport system ATP-binding protein
MRSPERSATGLFEEEEQRMSLTLRNVSKLYGVRKFGKKRTEALANVSLRIEQGEFVGILGRSGAGKSTLIRCVNQLVQPTSGSVMWNGITLTQLNERLLRDVRREIGMIFQQFHLIPRLTALQNCVLGRFGYRSTWKNTLGIISSTEQQQAQLAQSRVGLEHLAHRRVDQLSGGQQQRVAIARVIVQQPKLLLGDEPVASLDPITTKQIMNLIQEVHRSGGMTTVMNLHDVDLALRYCDRIIGLSAGRVVFDGTPDEVNETVLEHIYM